MFCLVFFPFLFGVMFGDVVHGTMMLCFCLTMIGFENRLTINSEADPGI